MNSSEQKIEAHKKIFSPDISGQITASIINGTLEFIFYENLINLGNFNLQNFSISGLPNNIYYLYIQSDSINFPSTMKLLPNERFSTIYYYFLPIKLSVCPDGGILVNKSNG